MKNHKRYSFDGIDLAGQRIIFQINSETLKTDSITRLGGGHIDLKQAKTASELEESLKRYAADDKIYGVRIELKTQQLKASILKKLEVNMAKGQKIQIPTMVYTGI